MQTTSTVHSTLRARGAKSAQVQDSSPRPSRVRFTVKITGAGESRLIGTKGLDFGALMLDEPSFSYGVIATSGIPKGGIPSCTAIVLDWVKNSNGIYTGADVGFLVECINPKITVKFSLTFEGTTLRANVGNKGDIGNPGQKPNTFSGSY